jgi:hypothetical protein
VTDGILFIEGFDGDASSLVWETMWQTASVGRHAEHARTGGTGVGSLDGNPFLSESPLWEPTGSLVVGLALRLGAETAPGNDEGPFLHIMGPLGLRWLELSWTPQRTISAYLATDGGQGAGSGIMGTTTYSFDEDAWVYLEVALIASTTGNRCIIQVNGPPGAPGSTGAEILDVYGAAIYPGNEPFNVYNQIRVGAGGTASPIFSADDLYIRDGTVGGFLGDSEVLNCGLESDRAVEFVPLSGADNYLMVDELTPDDDGTYNETAAAGATDVFEVAGQVLDGQIHVVQLVLRAEKSGSAAVSLASLVELDGTTTYGTTRFVAASYETTPPDVFANAPGKTGWTLADLNAVGVGYYAVATGGGS